MPRISAYEPLSINGIYSIAFSTGGSFSIKFGMEQDQIDEFFPLKSNRIPFLPKVVVNFFGGGVSITPETSEGGNKFYATNMTAQDFVASGGFGSNAEENPFKDWSFIVIPYATGNFHSGTGVYEGKKTVHI